MTDPARIPDPVKSAQMLPNGAAIIYRHYGSENRHVVSARLRQITFERGQQFLIGHDPELAIKSGADGVHFRRDKHIALPALWRQRCPDWIITMAGMKTGTDYKGDLTTLDALFISSIFPSQSASAGPPIGTAKLDSICAVLSVPVIALGGISSKTTPQLTGSGAFGLAGVSGLI